jgi:hypothetical protein
VPEIPEDFRTSRVQPCNTAGERPNWRNLQSLLFPEINSNRVAGDRIFWLCIGHCIRSPASWLELISGNSTLRKSAQIFDFIFPQPKRLISPCGENNQLVVHFIFARNGIFQHMEYVHVRFFFFLISNFVQINRQRILEWRKFYEFECQFF